MNSKTLAALAIVAVTTLTVSAQIDLSTYVNTGRYALPDPSNTTGAPNLLASEASGVAYNRDTDTLFIVGDGGRSVTQVSKTGAYIDSMTLALGGSPQGTSFYDTEGIAYVGNGQFVVVEERYRQASLVTYAAGTTLAIGDPGVRTVKLGTTIGNIGLEGHSYDPLTGGYIFVKESGPLGIFQTTIDFNALTASNGSPSTVNSTNLFNPALAGLLDFSDVFALSNISGLNGSGDFDNLLVISQESGRVVELNRSGSVLSSLNITSLFPDAAGDALATADQQHEGLTMDLAGNLYIVNENGGGDINHPQLWVYSPVSPIPEPSTYAALAGLGALSYAAIRRRRQNRPEAVGA